MSNSLSTSTINTSIPTSLVLDDVQTYFYSQLLDHFNNAPGSNTQFQQSPLEHSHELKDYLRLLYNSVAQYSFPLVRDICKAIDGAAFGSDVLSKIYGAAVVYEGNNTCKVNPKEYDVKPFYGWHWQTEKAYLKQPKVFLCSKKSGKGKRPGKGGNRFWKSVGLGFKTPKEAIEGTFIDKKCPFTGNVSIRGRIIAGTCHSAKMNRTIIVRRNYLHFIKKYQRYEKRHSNIPAHVSPAFRVKEGDHVIIGQCRPLSKTVRFNVLKVIPAGSSSGAKKAFSGI
ncbi:hypothetical protein KIW84_056576 [Lathyrus oleraceus]|uniref:Small ribosomal subunit protein uS17 n=1 Tax=Pisum sativum TaxID=3888 RepID=A0A9D4X3M8_PEA|nr:hypothetical protein KIW84_056576 [Pisum sativum]